MKTLALLLLATIAGCASIPGVQMTEDERRVCAERGCTVWTDAELHKLAEHFFLKGYQAGKKAL